MYENKTVLKSCWAVCKVKVTENGPTSIFFSRYSSLFVIFDFFLSLLSLYSYVSPFAIQSKSYIFLNFKLSLVCSAQKIQPLNVSEKYNNMCWCNYYNKLNSKKLGMLALSKLRIKTMVMCIVSTIIISMITKNHQTKFLNLSKQSHTQNFMSTSNVDTHKQCNTTWNLNTCNLHLVLNKFLN